MPSLERRTYNPLPSRILSDKVNAIYPFISMQYSAGEKKKKGGGPGIYSLMLH